MQVPKALVKSLMKQEYGEGRPDPRAALRALHSGLDDPLDDTRPRTPLSVGLFYLCQGVTVMASSQI